MAKKNNYLKLKVNDINANLNIICEGLKTISRNKIDLYDGVIRQLDGNEDLNALEKFRSLVSLIGDTIVTKGSVKASLSQLYRKEFKDILYNLVDLTQHIKDLQRKAELSPIIKDVDNTKKDIKELKKEFKTLKTQVGSDPIKTNEKQTKKKNKIWQKVLFGFLLTTSVLGASLGVKSCVHDVKQDKDIEGNKTELAATASRFQKAINTIHLKNGWQDVRLNRMEHKDTEQDNRLDAVEKKNDEQNNRLDGLEKNNKPQTQQETKKPKQDNFEKAAEKLMKKQAQESMQEEVPTIRLGKGNYDNQEVINYRLGETKAYSQQ